MGKDDMDWFLFLELHPGLMIAARKLQGGGRRGVVGVEVKLAGEMRLGKNGNAVHSTKQGEKWSMTWLNKLHTLGINN